MYNTDSNFWILFSSPRKELNKIVKDIGGMLDTELTVETTVEVSDLIYN